MARPSREAPSGCTHCGLPMATRRGTEDFCCFGCRFAYQMALPGLSSPGQDSSEDPPPSTLFLRLGLGIFLAFNIMAVNWVFYSQELFGRPAEAGAAYSSLTELFAYLALFLATAVLALLGIPLLSTLLKPRATVTNPVGEAKRRRRPGSSHLILLGVFSAYALSVFNTVRGQGSLYFDTAAMVLVAVTLGSFVEGRAKLQAARSTTSLHRDLPPTVLVRRGASLVETRLEDVTTGDVVRILPGELIAVDGPVVEGVSRVDEASLTGEARPRTVEGGSALLAGTHNLEGQLWVRTERVGTATILAQTERSLLEARALQPAIQRLADRVAGVFVPAVILLALAVFAQKTVTGDPGEGILRGLAVLLISCPCALGLAAPLASWNALRRAAARGILVDSAVTLERAATVDRIYFDKTGTLTEPELDLEGVVTAPGVEPAQAFHWAARLEAASPHPIARAFLRRTAQVEDSLPSSGPEPAAAARVVPGRGVEGEVDRPGPSSEENPAALRLRLGSETWVREKGLSTELDRRNPPQSPFCKGGRRRPPKSSIVDSYGRSPGLTPKRISTSPSAPAGAVFLFTDDRILARFELVESLRPGAAAAVTRLRALGIRPGILTGDSPRAARAVADQLGIAARGALLPADKVACLSDQRKLSRTSRGARLAMVGDGLNDAPVLAAADLGIAVGSASDLARRCANVRLVEDRLDRLPILFEIARDCRRRIRRNLAFSFAFNSVGMGLAATGRLNPIFAAIAMVVSSLVVVRISSRAGQTTPNRTDAPTALSGSPDSLPANLERSRPSLSAEDTLRARA